MGTVQSRDAREAVFEWRDGTILDCGEPIARFSAGAERGDCSLRDVVLRPGGPPLVNWVFGWWSQTARRYTNVLDDAAIDDDDPAMLKMRFISSTPDGEFTSDVRMTLSLEEATGGYVYDVNSVLKMNRFPFASFADFGENTARYYPALPLEYANVLPIQYRDWDYWIYRNVEESWTKLPNNFLYPAGMYGIQFSRRNAILAMVGREDVCPTVRLLGATPHRTQAALCRAVFDMHLRTYRVMAARRYRARYRVCARDKAWAAPRLARASITTYTPEEIEEYERPRFDEGEVCEFDRGVPFDQPDFGGTWIPFGDVRATRWEREGGIEGKGCLVTESHEPVTANWQLHGGSAPVAAPGRECILSAYVRTKELEGEGAYIFWHEPGPVSFDAPERSSLKVTGTSDWIRLEVRVPPAPRSRHVLVGLQHKGKGMSRFSRVSFEVTPGTETG